MRGFYDRNFGAARSHLYVVGRFDAAAVAFGGAEQLACFGDLPGFGELLNTSDSQPASLTSIGRNTEAAIAAMMVRRRGQTAKPAANPALANFLPDDSNPCFPPE